MLGVACSQKGELAATCSTDGTARVWSIAASGKAKSGETDEEAMSRRQLLLIEVGRQKETPADTLPLYSPSFHSFLVYLLI